MFGYNICVLKLIKHFIPFDYKDDNNKNNKNNNKISKLSDNVVVGNIF